MKTLNVEMATFSFGPFALIPGRQLLAKGSKPVRVGLRCFDILLALVERAGEVVAKEELMSRAWPDTFVEEGNLKVNVAALRRVLGDNSAEPQYVATVNGRGYRFVAPVVAARPNAGGAPGGSFRFAAPAGLTQPIGRDAVVREICDRLPAPGLVTIAGPGGIGKTTVALSVAAQVAGQFGQSASFVDLTDVREPSAVPAIVAEAVRERLGSEPLLLILDNCEHLVCATAAVVDELMPRCRHVQILATSHEPLGVRGELVYRLPPLEAPREVNGFTMGEAQEYSAIQLFVRLAGASAGYRPEDGDAPFLAEVCRRLDGNPLAMELAAARMDSLGLRGLAALLDRQPGILQLGARTGPPRHRTFAAALDWSYGLLSECEQALLRRLSVLRGPFHLDAAIASGGDDWTGQSDIGQCFAALVAKSLVISEVCGGVAHFRLPETTRIYAAQKLVAVSLSPRGQMSDVGQSERDATNHDVGGLLAVL